jgi:hypothetical protein
MRQLDEGSGYRALIEAEFAKRLGRRGLPPAGSSAPATVERETPVDEVVTTACAACGQTNDTDARFCKHCGARVTA